MKKIHTPNGEKFIAYDSLFFSKNKGPSIIFCHGLMSDMNSSKAIALQEYCRQQEYNYIRFDNFGSGNSSGRFDEQTITSWVHGVTMIIDQLAPNGTILIGSSKGGWISLIAAMQRPKSIKAVITIAAATDFTEEIIWKNLTQKQRDQLATVGITNVTGKGSGCEHTYPINIDLINDGKQYLMFNESTVNINCPVHLIHGMKDVDVPYSFSIKTAERLASNQVVIKLIKDGDHKLARTSDIKIIANSIEEVRAYNFVD